MVFWAPAPLLHGSLGSAFPYVMLSSLDWEQDGYSGSRHLTWIEKPTELELW